MKGWEGLGGAPGPAQGQSRVNWSVVVCALIQAWLALPVPARRGGPAGFPLSIWLSGDAFDTLGWVINRIRPAAFCFD